MAAANVLAGGFRRIPWGRVLWLAREAGKRGSAVWRALGEKGRKRFVELVRESKGRPDKNLSQGERDELRSLASKALKAARSPGSVH
jgi:hypothetical protein